MSNEQNNTANTTELTNDQTVTKRVNFNEDEDTRICEAWVAISENPETGSSEPPDTFWGKVLKHFVKSYLDDGEVPVNNRDARSLENRFNNAIKRTTANFCGYHANIVLHNQSRKTDDELVRAAKKTYRAMKKKDFKLLHCYEILNKSPQWRLLAEEIYSPKQALMNDQQMIDTTAPPIEREAATESNKRKRDCNDDDYDVSVLCALQRDSLMLDKERNLLFREAEEEKIMSVDVDLISCPIRATYYKIRQKLILENLERMKSSSHPVTIEDEK